MTREETVMILTVLRGAYPNFYRGMSRQEGEDVLNLWTSMFADDSPELVGATVKTMIAEGGAFPPSIGEVKNRMYDLTHPGQMSETEAWSIVSRAAANSGYMWDAREEFDKLPPILKKAVGSAEQLNAWAKMNVETVDSVVASNFMRGFKTIRKRERDMEMVPADVRALLSGIARRLDMDRKNLLEGGYNDGEVKAE